MFKLDEEVLDDILRSFDGISIPGYEITEISLANPQFVGVVGIVDDSL